MFLLTKMVWVITLRLPFLVTIIIPSAVFKIPLINQSVNQLENAYMHCSNLQQVSNQVSALPLTLFWKHDLLILNVDVKLLVNVLCVFVCVRQSKLAAK